ncbi:helix-turn-helix domain-containing protein [Thermopolyspora sp. NPDC052614]|uniref:TetR/AcrR family transcriptional regulator n=1 Tax=Thermopolyspora sp. NPDC052614 TaxID=3155682 RepID=UPI003419140C
MRLTRTEAREANRRALLDAARTLLARDGADVSVEAIAAAADLTTGAIYSIFGSKSDLLVSLLADDISRVDVLLEPLHDPEPSLAEVIDRYVAAWFATYGDDSKAQTAFELRVILAAIEDDRLLKKLTKTLDDEIERLAAVLVNRVIDPARPSERTTAEQSLAIAKALKSFLTGFGLRQVAMPEAFELARRSCLALTSLASDQGSTARPPDRTSH